MRSVVSVCAKISFLSDPARVDNAKLKHSNELAPRTLLPPSLLVSSYLYALPTLSLLPHAPPPLPALPCYRHAGFFFYLLTQIHFTLRHSFTSLHPQCVFVSQILLQPARIENYAAAWTRPQSLTALRTHTADAAVMLCVQ